MVKYPINCWCSIRFVCSFCSGYRRSRQEAKHREVGRASSPVSLVEGSKASGVDPGVLSPKEKKRMPSRWEKR